MGCFAAEMGREKKGEEGQGENGRGGRLTLLEQGRRLAN